MSAKEELIKARAYIANRGQVAFGTYFNEINDCACMAGAVLIAKGFRPMDVMDGDPAVSGPALRAINMSDKAFRALAAAVVEDPTTEDLEAVEIFDFNDTHVGDIPAILAAFDKAIASLES